MWRALSAASGINRRRIQLSCRVLARVQSVMLVLIVALLAIATVLAVLSMLPKRWTEAPRELPAPLAVELIEPARLPSTRPAKAMSVGPGGFGTILSAPGRLLVPSPEQPALREPALAADPPVAAQVAGLVRLLSRVAPVPPSDQIVTINLDEPPRDFGTVILRDGCLRVAEAGEPHAIFPAGTWLYIDDAGFLTAGVIANDMATNARLGEPAWWSVMPRRVDAAALGRIRAKCGPGAVRLIGLPQSVSASQAAADGVAARNLVTMYGLPWTTALPLVRECRARLARNSGIDPLKMIENPCGSTPPSPVANPRSCPPGTSLSGGLCRTPSGHIRPIPVLLVRMSGTGRRRTLRIRPE